jgi:hypothetical protein
VGVVNELVVCGLPSDNFENWNFVLETIAYRGVQRYAMHGFWGNLEQLLELYARKDNEYIAKHMTKIRESIRQQKQPRVMETQKRRLRVDWKNERGLCGLPKKEAIGQFELCNLRCFTCAHSQTF